MISHQPLALWGSVGVAALLAIGAASGGLEPRTVVAEPSAIELGESVDLGPYDIVIERARVLDELPGVSESDATRVIAVVATVTVDTDRTQGGFALTESVTLEGIEGVELWGPDATPMASSGDEAVPAQDAYVIDDGSPLDSLQPGIAYETALVWEQPVEVAAPEHLDLVLIGRTLRTSSIDHSQEWLDPVPVAQGEIEVEPVEADSSAEETSAEEPATEEPATEEPATEEPATEEPATEEPAR